MNRHAKRLFVCLLACFTALGLLSVIMMAARPAAASGYAWASTGGGVGGYTVNALAWDGKGESLYAGTAGHGVWRYDPGAGTWADTGGGVSGYAVNALAWDGEGSIYAGTDVHGVWCYDLTEQTWTDTGSGFSLYVTALAWDGTSLYAAVWGQSVWRYEPDTTTWYDIGGDLTGYSVRALAWDGTRLYAGADSSGVWYYDLEKKEWATTGGDISGYSPLSLAWDGSNGIYAGTFDHGTWYYDIGTGTWTDTGGDVSGYTIHSLAWDGTGLYAGTSYGIWYYDPATEAWADTGGEVSGSAILALACTSFGPYAGRYSLGVWERVTTYTIEALADPPAGGTITGAGTHNEGQLVELEAVPDTANGWHFVNWMENGAEVSASATYSFNATSDRSLTAHFAPDRYAVTATADPPEGGVVTGMSVWTYAGGGMNEHTIYAEAWDGTGLYVGTWGHGVWRYDPVTGAWNNTGGGMSSQIVYSLTWDGTGLYAGTDHGVWYYDPVTGTWADTGGGVSSYIITSLAWDGTGLYAGTYNHGVWRYDPGTGTWTDTAGGVSSYIITSLAWDGTGLYAGTNGHGAWRYSPATLTWADVSGAVSGYTIHALAWDGTTLYAGTYTHGMWRYDPGAGTWADTGGVVSSYSVHSLAMDGPRVYAGTDGHGVWHYDPETTRWTETGGGLSGFTIRNLVWDGTCLYADTDEDGIWRCNIYEHGDTVNLTATPATGYRLVNWTEDGKEVCKSTTCSFSATSDRSLTAHFTIGQYAVTATAEPSAGGTLDGVSGWTDTGGGMSGYNIYTLAWGGTRLYAGTVNGGVWCYDPAAGTWTDTLGGMSAYQVVSLAWDGNLLYAGTWGNGVWRYDPAAGTWTGTGGAVSAYTAYSLAWDGTDLYASMWDKGVWRYDPETGTWSDTGGGLSAYYTRPVAWDGSGCIYAAVDDLGIWCYDIEGGVWTSTGGGMSGYNIWSLAWDGTGLYAGTFYDGVWRYDPETGGLDNTGGPVSGYGARSLAWSGSFLYAGIQDYGVWRYDPATGGWTGAGGAVSGYDVRSLVWGTNGLYTETSNTEGASNYGVWRYGTFTHGETVDLTASPATGYHLVNWTEEGMEVSTSATYSFTATADRELVANFALNQYAITTAANPPAGGVVTGTKAWADTSGGVSSYSVLSMAWDGTGLYAGTDGHGVWYYDPELETWSDTGAMFGSCNVWSLAWDGTGLYAGTDGHGVWYYDPVAVEWTDTSGGVSGYTIYSLAWDGTGLYAGTNGQGVWRYDPGTDEWDFPGYGGSSSIIYSLAWDGTGLYEGMSNGVWYFDPVAVEWTDTSGGIDGRSLAWDGTGLYAGTYANGVWRYDPATEAWTDTGGGISGQMVPSLAWDGTELYAGAQQVWRYDPVAEVWTNTGGGAVVIYSLAWGGSSLYAGNYINGVLRCDDIVYSHGDIVNLTATPAAGYQFVNWTEGGTEVPGAGASYSFTATADRDLVAHFSIDTYTLSISLVGNGSVFKDPSQVSYGYGIEVRLTATPSYGWYFVEWTGDLTGSANPAILTMDASKTVLARFALNSYTIAASADPLAGGTVTGATNYNHGNTVNLIATPADHYHFINWTEDGTEVPGAGASYSFTAIADRTLVAHFALDTHTLSTGQVGNGSVSKNPSQTSYEYGTSVQLTATPATGWHFWEWSGDITESTNPVTITMDADKTVTAHFNINQYTINVIAGEGGSISPSVHAIVDYGASQTFTITPATGYHIVEVKADGISKGAVTTYTFTNVTANHIIGATFAINTYTITASAGEGGSITPSGTVTVNHGASQSFTMTPDEGYVVADVTVDGVSRGAVATVNFTNVTANHTVSATFAPDISPLATWYLAEGSTNWGFDCYISIINPNDEEVDVTLTYMTSTGPQDGPTITMPAASQATVFPSTTLGAADFSTQVTCTDGQPISVDRTMYWTGPTSTVPEAHCATGVTAPATTWYMPEGSSNWGFESFVLIQNPNPTPTSATVTWMIEGETPVTSGITVPAASRSTLYMSYYIGAKDASIKVESDSPVICERAMYRNDRREGHDSGGTPTAANDYYLAEGCTGFGFTTYVLVQNPNNTPTDVEITYQAASGEVTGPTFTMPANSRKTICVNDTTAIPGPDPSFSTHVHGDQPIIAERAMYWNGGDDNAQVCHDSIGLAAPHTAWFLADGQTSEGRETWTLVQNPNGFDVPVQVTYLTPDGSGNVVRDEMIPANSRKSFNMAEHSGITGRAGIVVTVGFGHKVMVERAMYWNNRGTGTDTIGGYAD